MVKLLDLTVFGSFEHFFLGFVYNLDYILKVLVVEFSFDIRLDFIYVCFQFLDNPVAAPDAAVQDRSVGFADDFAFLKC